MSCRSFGKYFDVHVVPVLKDNFSYVIHCLGSNAVAVVDVAEPAPVLNLLKAKNIHNDFCVLSTHKHWDHTGGNKALAAANSKLQVFGGEHDPIPAMNRPLKDGETFAVGNLEVRVMHTPCHTKGHVLYHVYHPEEPQAGALFTGDTLFIAGIGKFFEGTASDMLANVDRVMAEVPPETAVYPGHEYTLDFLRWAVTVEKENTRMKTCLEHFEDRIKHKQPTPPSFVGDEMEINMYMRTRNAELQRAVGISDPVKLMQHLHDA